MNELSQPRDLALSAVEAMLLKLQGVGVHTFATETDRIAHRLHALLEPRATTLENSQTHACLGLGEEGQMGGEAFVLPGLGAGLGNPLPERRAASRGQGIDNAGSLGGQGRCG